MEINNNHLANVSFWLAQILIGYQIPPEEVDNW